MITTVHLSSDDLTLLEQSINVVPNIHYQYILGVLKQVVIASIAVGIFSEIVLQRDHKVNFIVS